jgi:hypothetical protein
MLLLKKLQESCSSPQVLKWALFVFGLVMEHHLFCDFKLGTGQEDVTKQLKWEDLTWFGFLTSPPGGGNSKFDTHAMIKFRCPSICLHTATRTHFPLLNSQLKSSSP